MTGMMVTHFSLGSFFDFQGCSNSPFFILLERKYLWPGGLGFAEARGAAPDATPDDEPYDTGLEDAGVPNGLEPPTPATGAMSPESLSPG